MINAWHMLWIVPLSTIIGFSIAALLCAAAEADRRTEAIHNASINRKEDELL